ncbi:MAG: peptidylprolyl isomerase [Nitrospirota bacterium]
MSRLHPQRRSGRLTRVMAALVAAVVMATPLAGAAADRLVAVVNDELITASEVDASRSLAALNLLAEILPGVDGRREDPTFRDALESLIDQRLLLQEARALGLTATDDEARAAVQALTEERRLDGLNGASSEEIRRRVQDELTIVKLVNREVRSRLMINSSDVDAYYRAHPDRFTRPTRYRIRQIFIKAPAGGDPAATASARAEADAVRAEAAHGADFGELARRRSQGAEAARGGDLGFVRLGELLPEIDTALKNMRPGDVSPVIISPVGFHVINVVDIESGSVRPLEDVRRQAEEFVYQEQATDFYHRWLRQLRGRAHIDIKL